MRILITGHTGLLGTNLFNKLKDEHTVVGMSRTNGYNLLDKQKTTDFIAKFKPEIVYCLSANAAEMRGQVSPIDMTENNLSIFLHVLVPCINAKVKRFIYTSSVAVYGDCDVPYSEDDIMKPKDVYGVNKLACENILKILSKVHNFDYTIFRPHNIYGPYQDMSNPYKNVVALFMRRIREDQEINIYGGGKMRRAFSFVDDVVEVMTDLSDAFKNQTVNVGSSIEMGIADLLAMIETIAGKKAKVIQLPAREQEIYLFLASHKKLNVLHSYHETPLEEGLRKTWFFFTQISKLPDIKTMVNEII